MTTSTPDARDIRIGDHIGIRGAAGAVSHHTMRTVGRGFMVEVTYVSGPNSAGDMCVSGVEITQTGRRRKSEQQRTVLVSGPAGGQWNMIMRPSSEQAARSPQTARRRSQRAAAGKDGRARLRWHMISAGHYVGEDMSGEQPVAVYEVRNDPNGSRDNRWSLRRFGTTESASYHRLLKSAQKRGSDLYAAEQEQYAGCTGLRDAATLGRRRPHAGVMRTYEFHANGERARLCEAHGDMYGEALNRVVPDEPTGTSHYTRDGATAGCGEMNSTDQLTSEETRVNCERCKARIATARDMRNATRRRPCPAGEACSGAAFPGHPAHPTPAEAITAHYLDTREWPTASQIVRRDADLDALAAALDRGEVERFEDFTRDDCWCYRLPVPDPDKPIALHDVVTVDPLRRSRQFDVIALDDVDGELVQVMPRNPILDRDVEDGPRWVSLTYTHRVPAALIEPVEDDDQADTEPTEGTMRMTITPSGQAKIAAHLAARNTEQPEPEPALGEAERCVDAVAGTGATVHVVVDAAGLVKDGHDVDRCPRRQPSIADMIMRAMPEQYRRHVAHLLAPFGFAPPTGVDARVPSDANPEAFLVHDPTGIALGAYDRYVRVSYPATHAGEGDGDVGEAWFDLAYGTSFEAVADIAIGLSQRLKAPAGGMLAEPQFRVGQRVYPRAGGEVVTVAEVLPIEGSSPVRQQFRARQDGKPYPSKVWLHSDEYQLAPSGPDFERGAREALRELCAEIATRPRCPILQSLPEAVAARLRVELPAVVADYRQPLTEFERRAGVVDPQQPAYEWPEGSTPFDPGTGPMPGYVAGGCGHRVAVSEWRAGFRRCERCPDETAEERTPYVGEGADGARRSAEIDRTEADTYDRDSEDWQRCMSSAQRWDEQAEAIEARTPAPAGEPVTDAGGYLACGCHGAQRDHSCGPSAGDERPAEEE